MKISQWGKSQRIGKSSNLNYVSSHYGYISPVFQTYLCVTSRRNALYFKPHDYDPRNNFANYWPYQFAVDK